MPAPIIDDGLWALIELRPVVTLADNATAVVEVPRFVIGTEPTFERPSERFGLRPLMVGAG